MTQKPQIERRTAAECRAADGGRRLVGRAAVFNATADIGPFRERIAPGAFSRALAEGRDVVALVDHEPGALLARTRTGTLRLSEDDRGLAFELDVPDTTLGRDVVALADRGDLGGASFGFLVPEGGERFSGGVRELTEIDLREISVVHAWPAYAATSVAARAAARTGRMSLAAARIRILELDTP